MTKSNAREILANTLKRFRLTTGEGIGAVFTWHGKLATIGPENFQDLLNGITEDTWKSLTTTTTSKSIDSTKPAQDQDILGLLDGNLDSYNVPTLRRLVSWITKQSVGKNMAFWSDPSTQPSFWPEDVPYGNIKRTSKKSLCKIIQAYLNSDNKGEASPPHRSTRTERQIDNSRHSTKLVIDEVSDDQFSNPPMELSDIDTSSETFFPELQPVSTYTQQDPQVPTPSLATLVDAKPIEPIFEFTPILSHNVRNQSLGELSTKNTFLTDMSLNAFCVLLQNNYPHVQGLQDTILKKSSIRKGPSP